MTDDNEAGTVKPHHPATLFRPEAMGESDYGEAFAFAAPRWAHIAALGAAAVALTIAFTIFANFDRTAQVRGLVVPASGVARLKAPHGGVVSEVLVRQGGPVAAGAPLVRIASTTALPDGSGVAAGQVSAFRREQQAARRAQDAVDARTTAERRRTVQEIAQFDAERAAIRRQSALQRERIAKGEARLASLGRLRDRGYVSAFTYQDQDEALVTLRQQLAAFDAREAEAWHQSQRVRSRLAELDAQERQTKLELAQRLLALDRGAASRQAEAEVTLTAPVAGAVAALRVAAGASVTAGEEMAAIARAGDPLEILLFIPPRAMGLIRAGQAVQVRYDAFPYQRFGLGRGVVTQLAETAAPEPVLGGQSAYRVRVALRAGDRRFALRPDLTLTAVVVIERRSLFDWLFAPVREAWRARDPGGNS